MNHSYYEMFSTQKDGTIKPDCVLRDSKGVQYATTNTANRMLIDIELQEFFMNHFNVQLPIFIDEAQSFSDENMPEVKGQNILLKVSNDKYLIVE